MHSQEAIPLSVNADRLCEAISKIGYTPESALLDLVDNSITAGATEVKIQIFLRDDCTIVMKKAVEAYCVSDNGRGMNDSEITAAFEIGAIREYGSNSLSKYGMGLKSAGLSLGRSIKIISRKDGLVSSASILDRDLIRKSTVYSIIRRAINEQEAALVEELIPGKHGTLVLIEGTEESNQRSPKTIQQNLNARIGVIYYEFLKNTPSPTIELNVGNKSVGFQSFTAKPRDILHREIARQGFNADEYDCLTPCLVFDENIEVSEDDDSILPFKLSVVIFPRDRMSSYAGFTADQKSKIRDYDITSVNRGFFIYRNDRLIRWGDDLGIVGKDDRGFRACIMLNTDHDAVFHVDVSKQRFEISEELLLRIKRACQEPLKQANEAAKLCLERWKVVSPGSAFNFRNANLAAETSTDDVISIDPKEAAEVKKRTEEIVEQSEILASQDTIPGDENTHLGGDVFAKIRYSEKVKGSKVWESGFDPVEGDWVRINRNHSYFDTVLQHLDEASGIRQAIEALFWAFAAAENNVRRRHTQLDIDAVQNLFSDYQKRIAHYLEEWTSKNQDLSDDF